MEDNSNDDRVPDGPTADEIVAPQLQLNSNDGCSPGGPTTDEVVVSGQQHNSNDGCIPGGPSTDEIGVLRRQYNINDGRIPGGPTTDEIVVSREQHRSTKVFEGQVDYDLVSRDHSRILRRWTLSDAQIELVDQAGFGHFQRIQFGNHDRALCAALAERWWPPTCSFHFQFGEMTITLEDTYQILGLGISGDPVTDEHQGDFTGLVKELLGVESPTGNQVLLSWLFETFGTLPAEPTSDQIMTHTRAYLLAMCGASLFPDGTGNKVHVRLLRFLEDLSVKTSTYAWGAAVLAHAYHNLSSFSRCRTRGLYGCLTLIQVWAHEHLHVGRPVPASGNLFPRAMAWKVGRREYHRDAHHSVSLYRTQLDILCANQVMFAPYEFPDEDREMMTIVRHESCHRSCVIFLQHIHYHPGDRVMRQFGLIQTIPQRCHTWDCRGTRSTSLPKRAIEAWEKRLQDPQFAVKGDDITSDTLFPWCTADYRDWFGAPRIYNPTLTYIEPRAMPRGYLEQLYEESARCMIMQGKIIEAALEDPNSDTRAVLRDLLAQIRAPPPSYVNVTPDQLTPNSQGSQRQRRKRTRLGEYKGETSAGNAQASQIRDVPMIDQDLAGKAREVASDAMALDVSVDVEPTDKHTRATSDAMMLDVSVDVEPIDRHDNIIPMLTCTSIENAPPQAEESTTTSIETSLPQTEENPSAPTENQLPQVEGSPSTSVENPLPQAEGNLSLSIADPFPPVEDPSIPIQDPFPQCEENTSTAIQETVSQADENLSVSNEKTLPQAGGSPSTPIQDLLAQSEKDLSTASDHLLPQAEEGPSKSVETSHLQAEENPSTSSEHQLPEAEETPSASSEHQLPQAQGISSTTIENPASQAEGKLSNTNGQPVQQAEENPPISIQDSFPQSEENPPASAQDSRSQAEDNPPTSLENPPPPPFKIPLSWAPDGKVTLGWIQDLFSIFEWCSRYVAPSEFPSVFPVSVFDSLITSASEILQNEPNCVMIDKCGEDSSVIVVGDVHGQLHDVLFLFKEAGFPSDNRLFVFNGDYVDRGAWGTETFLLLLALKVFLPHRVYLLRGNHESKHCTSLYGFEEEVMCKYGDHGKHVYKKCLECFERLPLASVIAGRVYTTHGGLFRSIAFTQSKRTRGKRTRRTGSNTEVSSLSLGSLEDLSKVKRFVQDPPCEGQNAGLGDVLWSDPSVDHGLSLNKERGFGIQWGPDCTEEFLRKENLKLIIRSHEGPDVREKRPGLSGMQEGYTIDHEVESGKLITLFSAPDYPQYQGTKKRYKNKGAYIVLEAPDFDTPVFHSFEAVAPRPEVNAYYDYKNVNDRKRELDLESIPEPDTP